MQRTPLTIVYLTVFIDLLGFGIILPVLPFYALLFGASGFLVGVLLTAYSAAQLIAAPLLGRLSDRVGRRPVLLISLIGSAISLTITGLAPTLMVLILGRALAGLFGGSIATAQAYIADVTPPAERAKYLGLLGAAIGMGFVIGPAIGAGLSGFGFGTAALVAAGLALANFLFALWKLPESLPLGGRRVQRAHLTLGSLTAGLRQPVLGRILAATFLATFAFVSMEATFALLGERQFGLNPGSLGLIFTFVGIVIAAIQGGLIGRLVQRYGERRVALSGTLIMAVTLAVLPATANLGLAIVVLGLLAGGQGLVTPTLSSLLSRAAGADEQGGTLGLGQSLAAAARAVGPLIAGWLFDWGNALPYLLSGVLALMAAGLVWSLTMPEPERVPAPRQPVV